MGWIALIGCVTGPGEEPLPEVDTGAFYADVEPVLGERCANPSCHGSADRPLEVYAVHRHRQDDADTWKDAPLTPDEHAANLLRALGFVADGELFRKPLDPDVGGEAHGGGAIWTDTGEPEWQALRDWAEGK